MPPHQPSLFPDPEPPQPIDYCDRPRVPGRDLPCIRHKSYHSANQCREELQAVEDAFEAAGGFLTADGRHKNSAKFHFAVIDLGWKYEGYYIEKDGSHTFQWSTPKPPRCYSINVKDWDGTPDGLKQRREDRDRELDRLLNRTLL